jgi:flagellar biosynthesis protein FlhG
MSDAPPSAPKLTVVPPPAEPPKKSRPPPLPRKKARARRVIAIGGGKGGIGKSLIAANLGIELARRGKRVVLVDADLGGANLHTCLGVELPRRTISDFVARRIEKIEEAVTPTGIENLGLISGALDALDAANPKHAQKMRLLRQVQTLDVDYAILDLGAGTGFNTLDFFLVADHGILVIVPEPTSVENAYRFVKAAFWRRMKSVQSVYGFERLVEEAMTNGGVRSPIDLMEAVKASDPEAGETLLREMRLFRPRLIVNQVRSQQDAEVGHAIAAAWKKYFGLEMDYLGAVAYDDAVWRVVRARRPLLIEAPTSPSAQAIARVCDGLIALDARESRLGLEAR